jgi:hypothetical protein
LFGSNIQLLMRPFESHFQRFESICLAASLALLGGCGGSGGSGGVDATMTWAKITAKASCEALNPTYCLGTYGFSVAHDGSYTIGPNAVGQSISGQITAAELATLTAQGDDVVALINAAPNTACPAVVVPGSSSAFTVRLASNNRDYQFVNCTYNGAPSELQKLANTVGGLIAKYYPVPF